MRLGISDREIAVLIRCMAGNFVEIDAPLRMDLLRKLVKAEKRQGGLVPASDLEGAVDLLRDVATSGVSFEDPRVGYLEVQIDRGTWEALAAFRSRHPKAGETP